MRVNQLAGEVGASADTVRFYTRIGYLEPSKNVSNGYNEYSPEDKHRLRFILSARYLGFSVKDIGQILDTAKRKRSPCPLARELIRQRLADTDQNFRDCSDLRQRMVAAIEQWSQKPDRLPTGEMICHLIEGFEPIETQKTPE